MDNEYTIRLYSPIISKTFNETSKSIHSQLPKRFYSVSGRMFSKSIKRRASEGRRTKMSRDFRVYA